MPNLRMVGEDAQVTQDQQEGRVKERIHPLGVGTQRLYCFRNGWGASVVKTPHSYGGPNLAELAVIKWRGNKDFVIRHDSGITEDVLGWLTEAGVEKTLAKIRRLRRV